jgi:hypothetical protein
MDPEVYLTIHQQHERELARELELRRAVQDCPGCVVRAAHRVRGAIERLRALVPALATTTAVCCAA